MREELISCLGAIGLAMSVIVGQGQCLGQQKKPSIAEIENVWKARQGKVGSARFELATERTIYKGTTSLLSNPRRAAIGLSPLPENPPRDYLAKGTLRFSLSGTKTRQSHDDESWDPAGMRLYPQQTIEVFDGQQFKSLDNPSSGQVQHPTGIVRAAPQAGPALNFPMLPIIFTFRGSHKQFFQDLRKFKVTAQNVTIAGRPCLELVRFSDRGERREMMYVDQERDYVVVRFVTLFDDQPNWQLDATYGPDSVIGWAPQSWEYVLRAGKELRITNSGRRTVVRYEINPELGDSEFDIQFPPGTKVHDETGGRYVVYGIRESGEKGREVPANVGAKYEDLVQQARKPLYRRTWLWGIVLVVALAGSMWMWVRRRRARASMS